MFKSIGFAIVWGMVVLCTTFSQIITEGEFAGFMRSEFDLGTIGISIISMSIVFLVDLFITHKVSPFGKYVEVVFEMIILVIIGVLSIILVSHLNKIPNSYTIPNVALLFIIAKTALLWGYASMTQAKEVMSLKLIEKE